MVAASAGAMPVRRVNLDSIATAGVLGALALLWVLPFLWTTHWYPLSALHNELVAAACLAFGLLSCALLRRTDARLHWPLPALLLGLAGAALLQQAIGMLAYSQLTARFVLFMMATLAAYVLGRQVVAIGRTRDALNLLSATCLIGAIFSVVIQWLQLFDLEILPFWLAGVYRADVVQSRPFGNLAQSNHQATFLAFGAISAAYLSRVTGRGWLAPASLLVLATGLGLTGSRMGAAFLGLLIVSQIAPTGLRPTERRARWLACSAMIGGYGLSLAAVNWAGVAITALERPMGIRYELWRQAWQIAWQHPWLGVGVSQFGGGQYWVARAGQYTLPANNAHNLILDLAAEFGWPAAIATACLGLYWGLKDLRARLTDPGQVLVWGMMLAIAVHSMLEFPLWYLFFALPAGVLFAFAEPETGGAPIEVRRILPACGLTIVAVVIMFNAGYTEIARAASPQYLEYLHIRKRTALDALPVMAVADSKLFRPEVDRLLLDLRHPPDEGTPGPLERTDRLLHILPAPEVMAQHIVDLTRAGRIDEAIVHVSRLRVYAGAGYPDFRDSILDQTRDLGAQTAPLRHALRETVPPPPLRAAGR